VAVTPLAAPPLHTGSAGFRSFVSPGSRICLYFLQKRTLHFLVGRLSWFADSNLRLPHHTDRPLHCCARTVSQHFPFYAGLPHIGLGCAAAPRCARTLCLVRLRVYAPGSASLRNAAVALPLSHLLLHVSVTHSFWFSAHALLFSCAALITQLRRSFCTTQRLRDSLGLRFSATLLHDFSLL